jgi:hypothetical protein
MYASNQWLIKALCQARQVGEGYLNKPAEPVLSVQQAFAVQIHFRLLAPFGKWLRKKT